MEDDLLPEEQIKKKKRLVLLMLFTLLLVTAGAAMLLQPASPPSTAVAGVETPIPAERATPIANSTPSEFQGDGWIFPLTPSPKEQFTTPPATPPTTTATENPKIMTETHQPNTPTATSLTATSYGSSEAETIPTTTVTRPAATVVAEVAPTIDLEALVTESSIESKTVTEGSDKTASTAQAAPAASDISKRINESWDAVDEYYTALGNQINVSKTATVTKTLTGTTALSETVAAPPPEGLPVTGIITPRRMNWAALIMVILLIGTGAIAILYPKRLDI